jgi:hypothetical protein
VQLGFDLGAERDEVSAARRAGGWSALLHRVTRIMRPLLGLGGLYRRGP